MGLELSQATPVAEKRKISEFTLL